jgi:asparagine synthase (glutamine-hydrolysing)
MCGIFGKVGVFNEDEISIATKQLLHRGPDGQQFLRYDPNVTFFHARLSIVDLAAGWQPMDSSELSIIFNGEIYNHNELREKFDLKGNTRSDTETILMLYRKMGLQMLPHLDGMFALAIYNKQTKQLFLVRDRAGKKPLYFSYTDSGFYFGSELNLLYKLLKPSINKEALAGYLETGMIYGSSTAFENIHELKPGHFLTIDVDNPGSFKQQQWWTIAPYYLSKREISEEEALAELEQRLDTAVKRRVESSDLEVGSFLSGGIDSGLVTALAAKEKKDLRTFTVKFEGQFDESATAKQVADHLGTQHNELNVSYKDLLNDFESIASAYGEPFMDDSQIPSYYVAKEARKHLTVIINGDGGDEMFGGYRRYVPFGNKIFNSKSVKAVSGFLVNVLPKPKDKMSLYNYAYRLSKLNSLKGYDQYLSASTDLLHEYKSYFKVKPTEEFKHKIESILKESISPLDTILQSDFETILPYILLKKIDISSMQNSLEGRSPLLSKDIMEFAPTLPDHLKIKGTTTKYLLRQLAKKYLPQGNEKLPKRGFETPLASLLDRQLKSIADDYLLSSNTLYKELIDENLIRNIHSGKIKMSTDKRAKILFAVLCMEIWYKRLNA